MRKKLAIKGDKERGKEVIALLEMLGGDNVYKQWGKDDGWYIIEGRKIIYKEYIFENGHIPFTTFTLEEFYEKYPFKVNDKVIDKADGCPGVVCEMKWDEDVSDMKYCVAFGNGIDFGWFANDSIEFCKENENLEETQSNQDIDKVVDNFRKEFCERCGSQRCSGQDDELEYCERFKNLIKEEMKSKREYDELRMPLDDDDKLAAEATIMGKRILPPDGYLVGKITQTDNGMLVEYVEKKPEYPKTYEECEKILGLEDSIIEGCLGYEYKLLNAFQKLLMCRDAYWKIAGEELELSKPWKPDWNGHEFKYGLKFMGHRIEKTSEMTVSHVICFSTEEMRDAFYENFKDLIEQCKELL